MTNEEIRINLAQAKALHNKIAPAEDSPITMELRTEVAYAIESALLYHSASPIEVTYRPLERYIAIATLPKSEIEKMLGDDILTYATLENAELRSRGNKRLVMTLKLK